MVKFSSNSNGNVSAAMLLVIFSLTSSLAFFYLALYYTLATQSDCDGVQTFFFLRSETGRAKAVLNSYQSLHDGFYLPDKRIVITHSHRKGIFNLQSRVMNYKTHLSAEDLSQRKYKIIALVKAADNLNPAFGSGILNRNQNGYCEQIVWGRNNLLGYSMFFDKTKTTNDTNHYFWGTDIIYGNIHSNTDIWLKQMGGGTNNGWPTFYGKVFTSGEIRSASGTPPYANVFRAGYWEHVSPIRFDATATRIRARAAVVGPGSYDSDRIIFVTVSGNHYTTLQGYVYNSGVDTADVWTHFPPRAGTYLTRNRYTRYDTIWTVGPSGSGRGRSNIVHSKMWIRGQFLGEQTWAAVDTVYLNNDIYLSNTSLGQCPDGSVEGSVINRTDFVGIVSEKSILIQYGYKDPGDSLRYKPNCKGDGPMEAIWIYAALCALGDGNDNHRRDGVFSFEYQHPHPSVPAVRLAANPNYVWRNIDLHRRRYPQTSSHPWPGEIDYPWYNPLWPEGNPYNMRGTVRMWGSIAQRRAGYLHRQHMDPDYPNPNQIWNIPLDLCGAPSGNTYTDPVLGIVFAAANAPGASGAGVGYKRQFNYDSRFLSKSPPDFPDVNLSASAMGYEIDGWYFKKPPRSLTVMD